MTKDTFSVKLVTARMVTPTVRHLEFEPLSGQPLAFIPGQFITFHFELDNIHYQRSYSIATIPCHNKNIEIAVSPFEGGPGTQLLFNIEPGAILTTSGPFGRLILRDEQPNRLILIATGTGVTPYRSMLPELLERLTHFPHLNVVILLGVQTKQDLLYGEDFIAFANEHPRLQFHAYYSREKDNHLVFASHEHVGYVQTSFDSLNLNPHTDIIYLCGNPNMIDDAFNKLRELGFDTKQVRREKYISPKR